MMTIYKKISSQPVTKEYLIGKKVGRVLALIGLALFAILLRVWYLAVIRHEEYEEKSKRPQRRTVVEAIGRASIRDRFNLPLAINKMQFNVAVRYADIRQISRFRWETDEEGKKTRIPIRSQYIEKLAKKLSEELGADAKEIEDTIHAKASLMPHVPFIIAEEVNEQQYHRLRMLEKDWPGIVAQKTSRRHYPQGKVACDVLGMMGAISSEEYLKIVEEVAELENYIALRESGETPFLPKGFESPFEVRERLAELRQKAYTLRDLVGKSGIEAGFDKELRGLSGKRLFEVDVKGTIIRQLPMSLPPVPGKRVILTISSELQEYAEQILVQSEAARCKKEGSLAEPWIKGGAIVAMDAKSGEVLALASYPRFDPRDFLPSAHREEKKTVLQWLENEDWIAEVWDGHVPLKREFYDWKNGFKQEALALTWPYFLEAVLPKEGDLKGFFDKALFLEQIFTYQEPFLKRKTPHEGIDPDRLLAADLCRLIARSEDITPELKLKLAKVRCDEFFAERQAFLRLRRKVEEEAKALHATTIFQEWREKRFKDFLKEKRKEEREQRRYAKPYTDYLDQVRKTMFREFWEKEHLVLIEALLLGEVPPMLKELKVKLQPELQNDLDLQRLAARLPPLTARERKSLLKSFKGMQQLHHPLIGKSSHIRKEQGQQTLKGLAAAFYPINGYGFGRSQAFRQSTPAGSVFKLVMAYQAILEKYQTLKEQGQQLTFLSPLTITDESPQRGVSPSLVLGRTEEGRPITRLYKGGRMPRSSHSGIGKVDLISAIEQSSNIYFSILASEHVKDPKSLTDVATQFGFGEKSGIELPGEIAGKLPKDLAEEKTAIYAYAIGQHSLIVTPLQTALMIAAITGQGQILKPTVVQLKAGQEIESDDFFESLRFAHQEEFAEIGIHFPLFTVSDARQQHASVLYSPVQVRKSLYYPPEIRDPLLTGMKRAIQGTRGTARPAAVRGACFSENVYNIYRSLSPRLAGKTGTAEIMYKHSIDHATKAILRKHTWFAGVSFAKNAMNQVDWNQPDIVVVVYLRFAEAGREAAPLAALMINKWEEICKKHGGSSYVRPPLDDRLN